MLDCLARSRRMLGASALLCLLVAVAGLPGCATRSKVSASNEIATAMFAIRDARASGAETYSLELLSQAEATLAEAREAGGAEGERLAESALVYAQLANVVARREGARRQLAEAQQLEEESSALKKRTTRAVEERLR